jgi:GNAT superfamily N-acetyltransferase
MNQTAAFHSLEVKSMPFRFLQFRSKPVTVRPRNVADFLAEFATIAKPAGEGCLAVVNPGGGYHGFVQFIISSEQTIQIHRLWTLEPGKGNGSAMIRALCELADRHGVELKLKVIPIGRKPHPLSREQLKAWYQRHGFEGSRWILLRRSSCPVV